MFLLTLCLNHNLKVIIDQISQQSIIEYKFQFQITLIN